jgi:hypothetical protein
MGDIVNTASIARTAKSRMSVLIFIKY